MKERWGRLRQKLAALLAEQGYAVTLFVLPAGFYRTDVRADCFRWEAHVDRIDMAGSRTSLASWDTMTDCVRYGIEIAVEDNDLMVYAKHPRPKENGLLTALGALNVTAAPIKQRRLIDLNAAIERENKT